MTDRPDCAEMHPGVSHELWQQRLHFRLNRAALWETGVNLLDNYVSADAHHMTDDYARRQMDYIDQIIAEAS